LINPELKNTIISLRKASRRAGQAIWASIADELDTAKRNRVAVNLSKINRHSNAGETIAVPGKVLAAGSIEHPVTVAAFSFSRQSKEKIVLNGGRAMTLIELLKEEVEPSNIKIIK
jgi:large subunit ribosomal protein L18e